MISKWVYLECIHSSKTLKSFENIEGNRKKENEMPRADQKLVKKNTLEPLVWSSYKLHSCRSSKWEKKNDDKLRPMIMQYV